MRAAVDDTIVCEKLRGAFDLVVIDPPYIDPPVWAAYVAVRGAAPQRPRACRVRRQARHLTYALACAQTAAILMTPTAHLLMTTIAANATMLRGLLTRHITPVRRTVRSGAPPPVTRGSCGGALIVPAHRDSSSGIPTHCCCAGTVRAPSDCVCFGCALFLAWQLRPAGADFSLRQHVFEAVNMSMVHKFTVFSTADSARLALPNDEKPHEVLSCFARSAGS